MTGSPSRRITIPGRYGGPPGMAHGGYVGGLLAGFLPDHASVQIRLRAPTPLETPLVVQRRDDVLELLADGQALVECAPGELDLELPQLASFEEAERAGGIRAWRAWFDPLVERLPAEHRHTLATWDGCFGCSPRRDGLNLLSGPIEDGQLIATAVVPPPDLIRNGVVPLEIVWAAVDCPSLWACQTFAGDDERDELLARGGLVTGGLGVRVHRLPAADERLCVQAWRIGRDGRKLYGGAVLMSDGGDVLAEARQTAIAL